LFREGDIKKSKSVVAAKAGMVINNSMNLKAYKERVNN